MRVPWSLLLTGFKSSRSHNIISDLHFLHNSHIDQHKGHTCCNLLRSVFVTRKAAGWHGVVLSPSPSVSTCLSSLGWRNTHASSPHLSKTRVKAYMDHRLHHIQSTSKLFCFLLFVLMWWKLCHSEWASCLFRVRPHNFFLCRWNYSWINVWVMCESDTAKGGKLPKPFGGGKVCNFFLDFSLFNDSHQ